MANEDIKKKIRDLLRKSNTGAGSTIGNLNKAEIDALMRSIPKVKPKVKPKAKSTAREKAIKKSGTKNMPYKESSAKGGGGNYTPRNIKKMPTISREMRHGGSVKKSKKKKY